MYIGGMLIRRFDGFRRLCRRAADDYNTPLTVSEEDMLLANRILAALGGPPAPSEVRGAFNSDGLSMLLLFLMTQEYSCRIGLLGNAEPVMNRVKSLIHLLGHGVWPMVSGRQPLSFQEVVRELGPNGAALRPLFGYDQDGEPDRVEPSGGAGVVKTGSEGGPYTLAVLLGQGTGPAPLGPAGDLHPAVLILP